MSRQAQVERLCLTLGLAVGKTACDERGHWHAFDGRVLNLDVRYSKTLGDRPDSDSIHDLAHWLCASPKRRRLPEFGLGTGTENNARDADRVVSHEFAWREEECASLLGILIERELKLDWKITWSIHNWCDTTLKERKRKWRRLVRVLRSRGLTLEGVLETARREQAA